MAGSKLTPTGAQIRSRMIAAPAHPPPRPDPTPAISARIHRKRLKARGRLFGGAAGVDRPALEAQRRERQQAEQARAEKIRDDLCARIDAYAERLKPPPPEPAPAVGLGVVQAAIAARRESKAARVTGLFTKPSGEA